MNSISSVSSSMSTMQSSKMQRPPPPPDQDLFKATDSDSDGLVSETELSSLVDAIQQVSSNSLDVSGTMTTYDTDQDGSLNGEELLSMIKDNGLLPPENGEGESGGPPPPPPLTETALEAYGQNSGNDLISQLLDILQGSESGEETETSVNILS